MAALEWKKLLSIERERKSEAKTNEGKASDIVARNQFGYSCAGVPLFRRNRYRQSSGRKPLFRNRDTALN